MDLIAVVRFLGVGFVHPDQQGREKVFFFFLNYLNLNTVLCYIQNPLEDGFPMSYKKIMHF